MEVEPDLGVGIHERHGERREEGDVADPLRAPPQFRVTHVGRTGPERIMRRCFVRFDPSDHLSVAYRTAVEFQKVPIAVDEHLSIGPEDRVGQVGATENLARVDFEGEFG